MLGGTGHSRHSLLLEVDDFTALDHAEAIAHAANHVVLAFEHCPGKRIVLTGAMRPERFADSDAPINFGCAVGAANVIDAGVYVAMHGIVKRHDEMTRDPQTGQYR